MRAVVVAFIVAMFGSVVAVAQTTMDPTFAQHVKEWTTKPEFVSPLVDLSLIHI